MKKAYTIMFRKGIDTRTGIIYAESERQARDKFAEYCPSYKIVRVLPGVCAYDLPIITRWYEQEI